MVSVGINKSREKYADFFQRKKFKSYPQVIHMKKYKNNKTKSKTCKKLSTFSTNPPIIPPLYIYYINIYKGGYYKIFCDKKIIIFTLGRPRLGLPNTHPLIELKIIIRELHARDTKKLKTHARKNIIICPYGQIALRTPDGVFALRALSKEKRKRENDMH